MLWEIGPDGTDVRVLRSRLDLDSGYLSPAAAQAGEAGGLVTLRASRADGRVRAVRLTAAGLAERAELDRLSDAAAAGMLRPLSPRQRHALTTAMAQVERLLLASAIVVAVRDPGHRDARACVGAYFGELARRFDQRLRSRAQHLGR